MPINPNIHITPEQIVNIRIDDVLDAVRYIEHVLGDAEQAIVHTVDETMGTITPHLADLKAESVQLEESIPDMSPKNASYDAPTLEQLSAMAQQAAANTISYEEMLIQANNKGTDS